MKVLAVLALAIAASHARSVRDASAGYHARVGIPLARKLQLAEEQGLNSLSQRIIGGNIVDISQVPYHVAVLMKIFSIYWSYCGGSLISPTRVLTAAHCYDEDSYSKIYFIKTVHGTNKIFSTSGQRRFTTDIEMHPRWKDEDNWNVEADIAIIRIAAVKLSNVIQPIALPVNDVSNDFLGEVAVATGYGLPYLEAEMTLLEPLKAVELSIIDTDVCLNAAGMWPSKATDKICASGAGQGICIGDDGGPLVLNIRGVPTLIGVAYFSYCDSSHSSFTRVTSHVSWINSHLYN